MPSLRDVWHVVKFYARSLFEYLKHEDAFLWSQAIAFKALVSMIPLLIIGIGIFGPTLARIVRNLLPSGQGSELLAFVEKMQAAHSAFTIIGAIGLVLAGVTLFTTLRAVLANVFNAEFHRHRSIVRGYLFDLRMAGQIGVLFALTLAISALLQTFNVSGSELLTQYGLDFLWLDAGWRALVRGLGLLVPVAITTAIFFQLYYLTPLPHPPRRSVTIGALFAAILFEASKVAFAVYASRFGSFDRFASTQSSGGLAGIGDVFGVIIAFVFWAYFSGVVLILGAVVVLLHDARIREEADDDEAWSDMNYTGSAGQGRNGGDAADETADTGVNRQGPAPGE